MRADKNLFDDIWTPDTFLPARDVLYKIARRCGRLWAIPDFSKKVRIIYNPKLRSTVGRAWLDEKLVELNTHLLLRNPSQVIPTLVHELAHVAVRIIAGKRAKPHGREFKTIMGLAGICNKATHTLDVSYLKSRRRSFLYLHNCVQCKTYFIARSIRRNLYCAKCGPKMGWNVIRVTDSDTGKETLNMFIRHIENGDLSLKV